MTESSRNKGFVSNVENSFDTLKTLYCTTQNCLICLEDQPFHFIGWTIVYHMSFNLFDYMYWFQRYDFCN